MSDAFNAYHRWLGISPDEQPPNHYRLLGISLFEHDPEVIRDAVFRQTAHVRTYQLGPHSALSQKILNEISAAKVCLLDPDKRDAYDASLRECLAPTFRQETREPPPASTPTEFDVPAQRANVLENRHTAWRFPIAVAVVVASCVGVVGFLLPTGEKKASVQSKSEPCEAPRSEKLVILPNEGKTHSLKSVPPAKTRPASPSAPNVPHDPMALAPEDKSVEQHAYTKSESLERVAERLEHSFTDAANSKAYEAIVNDAMRLADQAIMDDKQDLAKRVAVLALKAASKCADDDLARKATMRVIEVQEPLSDAVKESAKQRLNGAEAPDTSNAAAPTRRVAAPTPDGEATNNESQATTARAADSKIASVRANPLPVFPQKAIDLLEKINVSRDAMQDGWKYEGARLISPSKARFGQVRIPYEPPDEYDLTVEGETRKNLSGILGANMIAIGLVCGESSVVAVIDNYPESGYWSGLMGVDGKSLICRRGGVLRRDNSSNTIVCQVRRKGITVLCNGTIIIEWQGDRTRLSTTFRDLATNPKSLFLATFHGSFAFSQVQIAEPFASLPESRTRRDVVANNRQEGSAVTTVAPVGTHDIGTSPKEDARKDATKPSTRLAGDFIPLADTLASFREHWKEQSGKTLYYDAVAQSITVEGGFGLGTLVCDCGWKELQFRIVPHMLHNRSLSLNFGGSTTVQIGDALAEYPTGVLVQAKYEESSGSLRVFVGDKEVGHVTVVDHKWLERLECSIDGSNGGYHAKVTLSELRLLVQAKTATNQVRLLSSTKPSKQLIEGFVPLADTLDAFREHWKEQREKALYYDAATKSVVVEGGFRLGTVVYAHAWKEFQFRVIPNMLYKRRLSLNFGGSAVLQIGEAVAEYPTGVLVQAKYEESSGRLRVLVGEREVEHVTVVDHKWVERLECSIDGSNGGYPAKITLSELRLLVQ